MSAQVALDLTAKDAFKDRRVHPRFEHNFSITVKGFTLNGVDISFGGLSFESIRHIRKFKVGRLLKKVIVQPQGQPPYVIGQIMIVSVRQLSGKVIYGAKVVKLSQAEQALHQQILAEAESLNALESESEANEAGLESTSSNQSAKPNLTPHIENRLIAALNQLKKVYVYHLPPELVAAKQELYKASPNLTTVENLIKKNPETLAQFIKIAQDAYPNKSIDQIMKVRTIINLIGLDNVFELLTAAILVRNHENTPLEKAIMKHGMNAALAAAELSDSIDGISRSEAYLAGLMQNIGAVFLSKADPENYRAIFLKSLSNPYSARQQELDQYETSHCEAGVIIAKNWKLPPEIYKGILLHHSRQIPEEIHQTHSQICNTALLMMLSDFVAASAMGQQYITEEFKQSRELAANHLKIKAEHVRAAYQMVATQGYKVHEIIGRR